MSDPKAEAPPQQNITVTTNLDTEPAHAEQLGHICVNWANLEWQMYTFELELLRVCPHCSINIANCLA